MNAFWEIVASNGLLVVVLAAAVAIVGRFWKNPHGLYVLWLLVLLKFVTPPLFTVGFHLPGQPMTVLTDDPATASPGEVATTAEPSRHLLPTISEPTIAHPDASVDGLKVTNHKEIPWLIVLAGLWCVGTAVISIWQAFRILRFGRLLHATEPAAADVLGIASEMGKQLGLRRIPAIRMLPVRVSPMIWIIGLRPQVLLPMELFKRLEPAAQSSLLAHELAHVRRRDHLVRLLQLLISTLFWWHPVVWWVCRELQQLEELCCDAIVVGLAPSSRKAYATALLDTLDFLCDGFIAPPLGATAAKSSIVLARRIAMMKNPLGLMRLTAGRIVLLVLAAALPMSMAIAAKPQVDSRVTQAKEVEGADVSPPSVSSPQSPAATDATPSGTHAKPANEAPSAPNPDAEHQYSGFILPGIYGLLQSPALRKQFNISGDQEKKLHEVSVKYMAAAVVQRTSQDIHKQIEQVLRPEQLAAIKHAAMTTRAAMIATSSGTNSPYAFQMEFDPSPEQKRQLSDLVKEAKQKEEELTAVYEEQVLGVLSREQREQLAAKFTGAETVGPFVYGPNWTVASTGVATVTGTVVYTLAGPPRSALLQFVSPMGTTLAVFPDLRDETVQKELGLTDEQKKRLQAVSNKLQTTAQGIVKDYESYLSTMQNPPLEQVKTVSAELQAKRAVCQKKLDELGKDIIQQVEAILTPAQMSTLKRRAMREKSFEAIANLKINPKMGESLGLSQQQQEKLHELDKELRASLKSVTDIGEKALKILTIPQQKKIEEEWTRIGP
jgi:beta-lactamase regulating signal transducer with metallopeptidase domain